MPRDYISLDDAATQLKVRKATLHYYIRTLQLETKKFPLDRRVYLTAQDFEKIRILKEQATERSGGEPEELDEDDAA